ncbi:DEAD/DEAH box helicase [Brevibacterium sp. 91QC2O2]|uniref:DEAD/DEAH box helicase n=1 Tax=Brevibacterium TaxID=1696 RepID=UPI00211BF283|nr:MULTISPECIES: DEAD/DEAH box helicase [unclassified Brevibacterium]MCQ9368619.1 DEAD/DEAH box helicase [Brevibacterium sp. 91QC2O2]MCQ9385349.1 DEAD/DEAH box helicase [Brevibacterium sp. 68QC2CO]
MASSQLIDLLTAHGARADRVTHLEALPARSARYADWPDWLHAEVRGVIERTGIARPFTHQAAAANAAHAGHDTVMATGTASGKSLGYLLPILDAVVRTRDDIPVRQATAIYLSPTKALAHDQLGALKSLPLKGLRPVGYDGDAAQADKDWGRMYANFILTNPDMLHRSVLPNHIRFGRWFKALRYIVIDEAHRYRGVFGSHVALVLRRLLRIAAHYGAAPTVIGASATMAEPAAAFARFTGRPAVEITEDGSPRAPGTFVLWEPPLTPAADAALAAGFADAGPDDGDSGGFARGAAAAEARLETEAAGLDDPWADSAGPAALATASALPADAPVRRSTISEAADVLADSTCAGLGAIAFIASRRGTEVLADAVRTKVSDVADELAGTVVAYRGGYLPEERRALELGLRGGRLHTVASTNALELGVDLSGMDLVVMCGWPGTLASLWQQAGRAGRAGREWLAVLIARDDPLDTFVVHHPEAIFGAPVDAGVIDPENPYVLGGHLCAAAQEVPLTVEDLEFFGPGAAEVVAGLTAAKMLRARPTGWFWAKAESAAALTDIRGSGQAQVRIVEAATGTLLGTIDDAASHAQVHAGAVYLHQGVGYVVSELDLAERVALVVRQKVDYSTRARTLSEITVESCEESYTLPSGATVNHGMVVVTEQVTGYQRKQNGTGVVLGEFPLDLPGRDLRTHAVWWTAPPDLLEDAGVDQAQLPGAVHAAEHASIGLLPLFAGCDRWDIGGVSTAMHVDTGRATVFVHDGQAGGAGFAERGFAGFDAWQRATLEAIESCECVAGCPSCVQSPKCGNGNDPLDKDAARRLLRALLHTR